MKVDQRKISRLMDQKGISPQRMTLEAQITPVYWSKIMATGDCCREIACSIATVLDVDVSEVAV